MASQTSSSNEDKIELRAVHDFDPRQMGYGDKMKLKDFLNSQRLLKEKESIRVQINLNSDETQIKKFIEFIKMAEKQRQVVDLPTHEKRPHRFDNLEMREKYDILYDRELCYSEDNGNLREMGFPRQDNYINPENESLSLESKQRIRDDNTSNNGIGEESSIMDDMETLENKEYPITNPEKVRNANHFIGSSRSEPTNPYKCVLTFRRGDKMETAPSANIGDTAEWWSARNFSDGEIGFIPRTQVVIARLRIVERRSSRSIRD